MIHDSQPFMLVKRFARKHKKVLNIEKFNNIQKEQMIQLIEDKTHFFYTTVLEQDKVLFNREILDSWIIEKGLLKQV